MFSYSFYEYIPLIIGIVVVLSIKIFLSFYSQDRKKHWYTNPEELAREFFNNKLNKIVVLELYNIKKLNLLLQRNFTLAIQEWKDIHTQNNKNNNGGILIDKMRNAALLINLVKFQHPQRSGNKDAAKEKLKILKATIANYDDMLKEIKSKIMEKKWITEFERKTLDKYVDDIYEIHQPDFLEYQGDNLDTEKKTN